MPKKRYLILTIVITVIFAVALEVRLHEKHMPPMCTDKTGAPWTIVNQMVPVPHTGAHYCPNVRSDEVNTNDLGYRGTVNFADQIEQAKSIHANGGKVIIFTGGSAAFGAFSSHDETSIAGLLDKRLERSNTHVFNFAMGYYTSAQELAAVEFYGSQLEPDLIVIMDGYNDMSKLFQIDYKMSANADYFDSYVRNLNPLRYTSASLDKVLSEEDTSAVIASYVRNINFLGKLGAPVVLFRQPMRGYHNDCQSTLPYGAKLISAYDRLNAAVDGFKNVAFVNLSDAFKGISDACGYFSDNDNVHMNDAGQAIVARAIYNAIWSEF